MGRRARILALRKPQQPGDLWLYEAHFYLIAPTPPELRDADEVVQGYAPPDGPQPYKRVRMSCTSLTERPADDQAFRERLIHAGQHWVWTYRSQLPEAWLKDAVRWLGRRSEEIIAEAIGYRVRGRRLWYCPTRLWPHPDRVAVEMQVEGERPLPPFITVT